MGRRRKFNYSKGLQEITIILRRLNLIGANEFVTLLDPIKVDYSDPAGHVLIKVKIRNDISKGIGEFKYDLSGSGYTLHIDGEYIPTIVIEQSLCCKARTG